MNTPFPALPLATGVIKPTTPAAGANLGEALGDTMLNLVMGCFFTLLTDGTAASRIVKVSTGTVASPIFVSPSNTQHPASTTRNYHFLVGWGHGVTIGSSTEVIAPLCHGFIVPANQDFQIIIDNKQAGDQLSDINVYVHQWIAPLA